MILKPINWVATEAIKFICNAKQLTGFYTVEAFTLTFFSPVIYFIVKPVIWFRVQIKGMVSMWKVALGQNGLNGLGILSGALFL